MPIPKPRYYISSYALAVKHGFTGTEEEWLASLKGEKGYGIPDGGTTGQILKKASDEDYDFEWGGTINPEAAVPSGGTTGQILKKTSDADYDCEWDDAQGGDVTQVDGINPVNGNVPLTIIGQSAPTTATVGFVKQRYFDATANKLYICTAAAEGNYTWTEVSAAVTVDAALDPDSENPVQNKVIYIALNGKQPQHKKATVTIATTDWNSQDNTAAVNVADVTASNDLVVTYAPASYSAWINNGVRFISQAAGTITLQAESIPNTSIDAVILILD
ncbi:MAG: hypothetical protein IKG87_02665 [Clostridia bacterium]|nr:hypothetical protein [Clostridia bacterium]